MARSSDLVVDGDLVRALAALLDETGLSEIEYAAGNHRIRVARFGGNAPAAAPGAATAPAKASAGVAEPAGVVAAPMVGTVHLAPQPGAAPFVQLGDTVSEGQVMFIVEAMKVMNQIAAPRAGRIAQILVAEGTPVEYGQALAILE